MVNQIIITLILEKLIYEYKFEIIGPFLHIFKNNIKIKQLYYIFCPSSTLLLTTTYFNDVGYFDYDKTYFEDLLTNSNKCGYLYYLFPNCYSSVTTYL